MPQNGLHGLAGLAAARVVCRHAPPGMRTPFAGAVTLGAMVPDIDGYVAAVAFLMGRRDMIYDIHRTATHSLLGLGMLVLAGALARRRSPGAGWTLFGLALGVATHILLDLFFWFAQLDLFWPFSRIPRENPLLPIVNLWGHMAQPHGLLQNLREAFEFFGFALFIGAVHSIRRQTGTLDSEGPRLVVWRRVAWSCFFFTLATALLLHEHSWIQNILVTTPYLLAFVPFCWWQTVRFARAIAQWSVK